jgi:hypothetical protein
MPAGMYDDSVMQATQRGTPSNVVPPPTGGPIMNGIPPQGGPMGPGGDPSGGLMPGQPPVYPVPGTYGGSPYPDAGCGGPGCGSGANVPRWWFNGEYLLWFASSQRANFPFVTTSAPGDFGILGAPTTQVLYSNSDISYGASAGFRLTAGWWRDCDKRCGLEITGFLMENKAKRFEQDSDPNGIPTLARPFNVASGGTGVYIVSNIGLAEGIVAVSTSTRSYGVEANSILNLYRSSPDDCRFKSIELIGGFRFFQLRETLDFDSNSTVIGGLATFVGQPITNGSSIIINDHFETENNFYGGQLGLRGSVTCGKWTFTASGKFAVGLMNQMVDVRGTTQLADQVLGINATAQGGVLATRENIGRYRNDEFAILPEATLNLAYNWTNWFSTFVGYNGLYVNRVVRPGNSLPIAVNPSLQPSSNNFGVGAVTPVLNATLTQTDFWIQGINFGFNVRF